LISVFFGSRFKSDVYVMLIALPGLGGIMSACRGAGPEGRPISFVMRDIARLASLVDQSSNRHCMDCAVEAHHVASCWPII